MKILFASAHLPSSTARQAGSRTSYAICEWLARNHEVHLFSFATAIEAETFDDAQRGLFAQCRIFPVTQKDRLLGVLLSPALPLIVAARSSTTFSAAMKESQRTTQFDVVILDHGQMLQYLPLCASRSVTVGSLHDIYSQMWQRRFSREGNPFKRVMYGMEARRVQRWEAIVFRATDLLIAHSDKDRDLILRESQPLNPPTYIHPKIEAFPQVNSVVVRPRNRLLYWGAMNRRENVDAVAWAVRDILPKIRQTVPDAELHIAGYGSDGLDAWLKSSPGVHVLGFVEDIGTMMSTMTAALLPLRLGAGIKIKTLECMSAGLPVITTDVGAEGTGIRNDEHAMIAETADALANAAVRVLTDTATAARFSVAGQQKSQRFADFDAEMGLAWERVTELIERKQNATATAETVGLG